MLSRLAGDLVVIVLFLFILFVVLGGLLVLRWPRFVYLHIPAALWGALVEIQGWICPLTPLENRLRWQAGQAGYSEGFVEHYVVPVLYPAELTVSLQLVLGTLVVLVNGFAYGVYLTRRRASTG